MLATSLELATKYNYLEEKFAKSIEWLKNNDATKLENGRCFCSRSALYHRSF